MFLCNLSDLPEDGAKGFNDGKPEALLAVRKSQEIFIYKNVCPHAGTPLNWMPDRFLTADKEQIICASHGAIFEINSGKCLAGPCPGQALTPLAFKIEEDKIFLT